MAENLPTPPQPGSAPDLAPWSNVVLQPDDREIEWIERLDQRARPLPPNALAIRELITRFEICHFKTQRHIQKILAASRFTEMTIRRQPPCGAPARLLVARGRPAPLALPARPSSRRGEPRWTPGSAVNSPHVRAPILPATDH